jgi:ribonuclease III
MDLSKLEEILGHSFRDKNILKESVTHRSYINEHPSWAVPHNERLEFLGDAVLELIVTEELYNRYPDRPEGELTSFRAALVNYQMLAEVGKDIGLGEFILLSRGEAKDTGRAREVILANAIEAVIGALYMDGGFPASKNFVDKFVMTHLDEVMRLGLYKDAKSLLQEKVQKELKLTPHYQVLKEDGPDHAKIFTAGVYFGEKFIVEGSGRSKHEAEIQAAELALEQLGNLQ